MNAVINAMRRVPKNTYGYLDLQRKLEFLEASWKEQVEYPVALAEGTNPSVPHF